ncbi:histidine phosphatase family protein [Paraburkholderia sp. PREW-6R]|uniref:histidine phosphatase family protein n=1 Tax=Paraburkholderia sp. PREW-6R TaxID=3141544 RepID=UPI0031F5CF72
MIVYLFRHGRSQANEAALVTGTPADELSAEGIAQAHRTAEWLAQAGIAADRYYVSQWGRARQTAAILYPDAHWQEDTRLGETHAGEVADWTQARFAAAYPTFHADPSQHYPGGESHLELNARALDWLHGQLSQPCDAVAVAAHSGPISCILQDVMGIGMARFPAFLPGHASLTVIEMRKPSGGGEWSGRLLGFSMGPVTNLAAAMLGPQRPRAS